MQKLKDLNFEKFWKGKYPKSLPLKYNDKDLLNKGRKFSPPEGIMELENKL